MDPSWQDSAMPDGPTPATIEVRLRRNRAIGAVASLTFLSVGAWIIVIGFVSVPSLAGVLLGRRRILDWTQVRALEVRDFRPLGAGRGPAHCRVIISGADAVADLTLYSAHDAGEVSRMLHDYVPQAVPGRQKLARISESWTGGQ
jgi:hypothetical protein